LTSAMENIYCQRLRDIEIDLSPLQVIQRSHLSGKMMIFDYPMIDVRLKQFLKTYDLFIPKAEVFYIPPGESLPIHVDSDKFSMDCKLNWVFGGGQMLWFKPNEDVPLRYHTTPIGSKYLLFNIDDCVQVYQEDIGVPSLVNVGIPHSVRNDTDASRWCISHNIGCVQQGRQIQWHEAVSRLAAIFQ